MSSPFLGRPRVRAAAALLALGLSLLPGACGGSIDIVFVGSDDEGTGGSGEGGLGGQDGEGGATDTGGTGTGGGSGGSDTGGTGGTISATCGDEEVDDGEDCDSGGEDSDECDFNCTEAVCGDRYTNEEAGEVCDDGADGTSPGCDTDCTLPACGDGLVHAPTGEQCDDGNDTDGDGCTDGCLKELLILGDGFSEGDAVEVLRSAGFAVTLAPVLEYEFDGTNPVLDEFCGVIQFNSGYNVPMLPAGQTALVDYVDEGGGFMSTGWSAAELEVFGGLDPLSELLLLDYETDITSGIYDLTSEGATHPVTSGIPATFANNSLGECGTCVSGSVALLNDGPLHGLCVSEDDSRRVISLGSSFGYSGYRPLQHRDMGQLLINSANWMCGTNHAFPKMVAGSTEVISRFGYRAQCQAWDGDVCMEPYLTMNPADVTEPVPVCIDDTTSMRPVWFGTIALQAQTWCWIATGSAGYISATTVPGTNTTYSSGWMYGVASYYALACDYYQRDWSEITIPTLGTQVWSFDNMDYVRDGAFMNVECDGW